MSIHYRMQTVDLVVDVLEVDDDDFRVNLEYHDQYGTAGMISLVKEAEAYKQAVELAIVKLQNVINVLNSTLK